MLANITADAARSIDPTEARRQRGLAIAEQTKIEEKLFGLWSIPSQTGNGKYWVRAEDEGYSCTCADYEQRAKPCKHVFAVRFFIDQKSQPETRDTIVESTAKTDPEAATFIKRTIAPRPTYKQDWPAYNAAQIHEKDKFQTLLAELCRGVVEPARPHEGAKGGRPPVPMADRLFAIAMKVYTTVSGRRASTDMRDARDKGYLSHAPHYSKVSRFLEDPAITPILMSLIGESARPLRSIEQDFIVDSSGFATSRFIRWYDHKYGVVKKQYDWVKVSVMTGQTTNIITAVEIDERYAGDCPKFAPLVNATAKTFKLREVSADAAYISYDNMELVASYGGTPYIAFKSSTTAVDGGTLARMFHLYNFNREEYLAHYHKRSNVESTFSMIKAKFGDYLRSKTDTAMVNEALCKVLGHNICCLIQSIFELGIEVKFWGSEIKKPAGVVRETTLGDALAAWEWV